MNPFTVRSPEKIEAQEAYSLFVDVFNDFPATLHPGHTFIHGPRGSGKSMMFRFMLPDCQIIAHDCQPADLSFLGCYLPVKSMPFQVTELDRLSEQARYLISEHLLCTNTCLRFIEVLRSSDSLRDAVNLEQLHLFLTTDFRRQLSASGVKWNNSSFNEANSVDELLQEASEIVSWAYDEAFDYCKRLAFPGSEALYYNGPLCNYLRFLHPFITHFTQVSGFPKMIFLLIDDADEFEISLRRILNTWVSYRLGNAVSLKVSTQMRYDDFRTISGHSIDSPHDYTRINISTVYTSSKNKYRNLVERIVNRRLSQANIDPSDAYQFFPTYEKQEAAIRLIYDKYIQLYDEGRARGSQRSNDANRYARPDYIKSLKSASKQGSKYSYSGFEQLVHLSSGIVRFFLEAAALMYSETLKEAKSNTVSFIEPAIQNKIIRSYSDDFLFEEFDESAKSASASGVTRMTIDRLRTLIDSLGGLFSTLLRSDASERRVFSIAISGRPTDEALAVLELGIRLGYFQASTIGNKEGTGRTKLYIMNRRLAPIFTLDPTNFAAYKFLKREELELAMTDTAAFQNAMNLRLKINPDDGVEVTRQLGLFEP